MAVRFMPWLCRVLEVLWASTWLAHVTDQLCKTKAQFCQHGYKMLYSQSPFSINSGRTLSRFIRHMCQ